ncbi:MAG: hypothetical protein J0M17_11250, partial [Planctomycetes bacterium]|nr:hypothetical protein [Planctomycetota bacterium]
MLVGGAVLLVLVLGGAFLVWRIMRASGDEAFRTAETAYNEGAYSRAIELYDQFLLKYPRHLSANQAVVHRGLSRIRLAVEGSNDWSNTRRATAEVLNEIATNEEFGGAHADLGVLLPDIAQNLAREALAKNSTALLEEAVAAQALVTKYLPASEVLTATNVVTETLFAQARFRFDRGRRAAETAAAMQKLGQDLAALRAQAGDYPFLTVLDAPLAQIQAVTGRQYDFYLTELARQTDALLDAKEQVLDPVRHFMNGAQKEIYANARRYLAAQEANFPHVAGD